MSAAAAAAVQATNASGVVIRVTPQDFLKILNRQRDFLVVHAAPRFFSRSHRYLTSYRGLAFWTKSSEVLHLPSGAELVETQSMWMPG